MLPRGRRGESWVSVPAVPNTILVNLGDMLERWTNGLYKSTMHRVCTSFCSQRNPLWSPMTYKVVGRCRDAQPVHDRLHWARPVCSKSRQHSVPRLRVLTLSSTLCRSLHCSARILCGYRWPRLCRSQDWPS